MQKMVMFGAAAALALLGLGAAWAGRPTSDRGDADAPAGWTLERELSVGAADGPAALSRVSSLAVADDGTLYVAQPQERRIKVFGGDGRLLGAVGRSGRGPGEFAEVEALGWRGDTLTASDPALARLQLFRHPDRRFLSTVSLAGGTATPVRLLADGAVLGQGVMSAAELGRGPAALRVERWTRGGRHAGSLVRLPRSRHVLRVANPARPGAVHGGSQPFSDDPLMAVDPAGTGLVVVERPAAQVRGHGRFLVMRYGADGRLEWMRTYLYRPVRLDDALVADSVRAIARRVAENRAMGAASWRDAERWVRRALHRPDNVPPVSRAIVGRDGSVWLQRAPTRGRAMWMVLDSDGHQVASIVTPPDLNVRLADATHVWGVENDGDDVPRIVRYRIRR